MISLLFMFNVFGHVTIGLIQYFYMKEDRIQLKLWDFIIMTAIEAVISLCMFIQSRFILYSSRKLQMRRVWELQITLVIGSVFEIGAFGFFIYFLVMDLAPAFKYHFFEYNPIETFTKEEIDAQVIQSQGQVIVYFLINLILYQDSWRKFFSEFLLKPTKRKLAAFQQSPA